MERSCHLSRILFWVNVAIAAAIAWEYQAIRQAAFSPGTLIGRDFGVDSLMAPIGSGTNSCTALRSISAECPACALDDRQHWPAARAAIEAVGCKLHTIDPDGRTPADIPFPSPQLAASGLLDLTPTLLVLDAEGRVIWRRIGVLDQSDAAAISATMTKKGRP